MNQNPYEAPKVAELASMPGFAPTVTNGAFKLAGVFALLASAYWAVLALILATAVFLLLSESFWRFLPF